MTFADAAVEVLRLVGRPMHFKKITQVAIAKNLLSHVGKTPEVTMSARLAAAVTKDRGQGPITRTKAGIFALREWGDSPPNGKEVGENDALPLDGADDGGRGGKAKAKAKAEEPRGRDDGKKKKDSKEAKEPAKDAKSGRGRRGRKSEVIEEEPAVEPEGRATTPESGPPAAVAAAVSASPIDDDAGGDDAGYDDEGGDDDTAGAGGDLAAGGAQGALGGSAVPGSGQGRRRRRRRRRRGGERPEAQVSSGAGPIVEIVSRRNGGAVETTYALGARGGEITAPPPEPADNGGSASGSGAYPILEESAPDAADADLIDEIMSERDDERELIPGLAGRPERAERPGRDRGERGDRDRGDRDRGDRGPDRGERRDERRPMAAAPPARPDDTLADGAYRLLFGQERTGGVPVRQLADQAVKAHMLPADSASPWMVVGAALRADIQRRTLAGARPRFRALSGGRWGLFEWGVGGEALRLESEATSVAERQREAARRTLLRRIVDMGDPQFEHLVLLLVDRLGYERPRRVPRPGAHRELHLAAASRVGPGGVNVALVFARSGREIDAARVTELRGALHHYGAAMGWIVTTGSISAAARDEGEAAGAPPIGLTDGAGFARLFEETGVGLVKSKVELSYLDVELLDALKSGA